MFILASLTAELCMFNTEGEFVAFEARNAERATLFDEWGSECDGWTTSWLGPDCTDNLRYLLLLYLISLHHG